MGWDGPHNRREHVAKMKQGWNLGDRKVTIRKHHASGQEDWYILDIASPDGTTEAVIDLVIWDGGYKKDMSESSGPYYYGCPVEWLDEVPEPEHHFYDWRKALRAQQAA